MAGTKEIVQGANIDMGEGIVLGICAALCFAGTDIWACLASRHLGNFWVTMMAQGSGLLILIGINWWIGYPSGLMSWSSLLISAGLGGISAVTAQAMYRGLERGPIALVSPLLSCSSAITAILAFLLLKEQPAWLALLLIFVGVLATSTSWHTLRQEVSANGLQVSHTGVPFAIVAMIGLGLLNFVFGTALSWGIWMLMRAWTFMFVCAWGYIRSHAKVPALSTKLSHWAWVMAGFSGLAEIGGLLFYRAEIRVIALSSSALIISLYSLIPALIGVAALKEKLTYSQIAGIALVVSGLAILAIA